MHRQFIRLISQNPKNVKTHCNDLNILLIFSIRKWMIKQKIDMVIVSVTIFGNIFIV